MENDILNFLTNEILDMFCSYKDQRIWNTLRDMLLRHGSQSEELLCPDLFIHTNNIPNNIQANTPSLLMDNQLLVNQCRRHQRNIRTQYNNSNLGKYTSSKKNLKFTITKRFQTR